MSNRELIGSLIVLGAFACVNTLWVIVYAMQRRELEQARKTLKDKDLELAKARYLTLQERRKR